MRVDGPAAFSISQVSPKWKELHKRARTLGITEEELTTCRTLEALQVLAKRKYKARVRQAHPDHAIGMRGRPYRYGQELGRIANTYKWFCALTPAIFARAYKARETVPDPELPLDWGTGWAEYDARYAGFTILPRL